jgi:hypothetical protein
MDELDRLLQQLSEQRFRTVPCCCYSTPVMVENAVRPANSLASHGAQLRPWHQMSRFRSLHAGYLPVSHRRKERREDRPKGSGGRSCQNQTGHQPIKRYALISLVVAFPSGLWFSSSYRARFVLPLADLFFRKIVELCTEY